MQKIKQYINTLKNLESWQKKKLLFWFLLTAVFGALYFAGTGHALYTDKVAEESYWQDNLKDNEQNLAEAMTYSQDATVVTAGTYVENLKEINIKSSYFRVVFNCWFRWEGDPDLNMLEHFRVYNGTMNKMEVLEDFTDGNTHYQCARVDVTISKNYWTIRFPLESYQMRIYLESLYPVDQVVLSADTEYSSVNPSIALSGFEMTRSAVSIYTMKYDNDHNDPEEELPLTQELVTHMELNRASLGLYMKCFIALIGTLTWVFITLFICTYHRVDPLGMVPGALFGTVTNIMVGANLLPDALQLGLLEYVNFAGIMIIILGAIAIVNINRIRNKHKQNAFASIFGRVMFYTLLFFTIVGIFWFPLMAYNF